MIIQLPGLAF